MSQGSLDNSRLVVFGDSLSDNGNLFDLIGLPQPPDWQVDWYMQDEFQRSSQRTGHDDRATPSDEPLEAPAWQVQY